MLHVPSDAPTISGPPLDIGVVGSGISGLAAAWLLSKRHRVTLYDGATRPGGHSHTVCVPDRETAIPVDTGFIVYNESTYPNLTALFQLLNVPTQPAQMSFAVSLDDGRLEYSGSGLSGLYAQKRNLLSGRFWRMLADLRRFYAEAPAHLATLDETKTLGAYLEANGYGEAFAQDHLVPMAAAIWSGAARDMLDYPAAAFIRFFDNHGLLLLRGRPQWRSVVGGSKVYVERLLSEMSGQLRLCARIRQVTNAGTCVHVKDENGAVARHDHVVLATHADQALALLDRPSAPERRFLGAFRYSCNTAVLHSDPRLMPKRRAAWAAWNHLGASHEDAGQTPCTVTYWMNALQRLPKERPFFVTLNPEMRPREIWHEQVFEHPIFDAEALAAQRSLWSLQGRRMIWFCGAYFGSGFHEDGLQAGLAVAEALGGVRRPWDVADESGRIVLDAPIPISADKEMEA